MMHWTDQEKEILKTLIENGLTPHQINTVLKSRTINGIRQQAEDMGLKWTCYVPQIDMEALKNFLKESKTRCL